ncbi:ArsA family ATPase [Streptomyces sp. OF3]|uniref:ArsA family ATPase n=2 Tax=Streptomyces alkaliterrae TaxID=2213162 RepID=A0A5P0YUW9_9ACTN|nr:ArsA family ATPase [Streptomyces alkaliterrae]MBB1261574.1 ArsA family ATPase [Streptomyces alkaliterrae]MQS04084.1 ArsA family ATPase [Streptomyces alkaliterrae]
MRTALVTQAADVPHPADGGTGGVTVVPVDRTTDFRQRLAAVQDGALGLLDQFGAQPLEPDEVTELPGAEPLALLRALRRAADGRYDLVVVDLPPAADAVRLLALPDQLDRYLRRLLPPERQAARALRPVLAQLVGVPMPARRLYETAEHWRAELALVRELVEGPGSSAVLVVDPGPGGVDLVAETQAGLALFGVPVEAVFAARMLPTGSPDPWLAGLAAEQQKACAELGDHLGTLPLIELPHLGRAPADTADLAQLGVPAPGPAPRRLGPRVTDRLAEDGELVWRLPLPGASRDRLDLVRRGDEVIVTVGPHRRALPLDSALRRCTVAGARLAGRELSVRFAPDPALWPDPR